MLTQVHVTLDEALVGRARRLGPLDDIVDQALRQRLDPADDARRRRWAEDNALLIEALDGGVEELALR
ncbi:MAG: type II toxin-antitoxin system CcdA family antitoxin [Pseudomonadota bacterium]|nr:type II toxin-antitoxin system CcdA family antitoxin [Pseudomonadota bacterium]